MVYICSPYEDPECGYTGPVEEPDEDRAYEEARYEHRNKVHSVPEF